MATPKITWGASFANTWTFPGPIDNPVPLPIMRGMAGEAKSGVIDVWEDRRDDELTFEVPLIPKETVGGATGYSIANGVQEALYWLAQGNIGRYFSDSGSGTFRTVRLIGFNPEQHVRRTQGGARYTVAMRLRDTAGNRWTEY